MTHRTNSELATDLRKLANDFARAFKWKLPSDDPRAVSTLFLDAAERLENAGK